jgi:hypothetical protein
MRRIFVLRRDCGQPGFSGDGDNGRQTTNIGWRCRFAFV